MNTNYLLLSVLLILFVSLFGCNVTINPQDISSSKSTLGGTVGDINSVGVNTSDKNLSNTQTSTQLVLTASEVAKHSTANDCWMIISNNVYNLTSYVGHPGGSTYVPYCGKDGTQGYDTKGNRGSGHSSYADSLLASYLVGAVGQSITIQTNSSNTPTSTSTKTPNNTTKVPQKNYPGYEDD
jgi:cytochrome b involved in lipid metabolism